MNQENTFTYNYSAAKNKEVEEIRKKYLPKEESKLEMLKRLDRLVQAAGMMESLTVGILGCLLFGIGMCFAMNIIGNSIFIGIIAGMAGLTVMLAAYPTYRRIYNNTRSRLAPQILELTAELTGEKSN